MKNPKASNIKAKNSAMKSLSEHFLVEEFRILENVSYWNGCYLFLILAISLLYSSLLLVIPQHNAIESPEYWFELIFIYISVIPLSLITILVQKCWICLRLRFIVSLGTTLRLFFAVVLGFNIPYCLSYIIWTLWLKYNPPMPFAVVAGGYPMMIFCLGILWFEFPLELRFDKVHRKRICSFILSLLWTMATMSFQFRVLAILFRNVPIELQWIMAIVLPISRQFNLFIHSKLLKRYSGVDNKMAAILIKISVGIGYSLFIAISLASATQMTVFSILGVDFILNLYLCFKILKIQRKVSGTVDTDVEVQGNVQDLVINETIEVLIPLAYFSTFLIAYYGPNSNLFVGIRKSCWGINEIEDIGKVIIAGLEMFILDLSSAIISGLILYKYCSINLFQKFCMTIKQCWTIIAISISSSLVEVNIY